MIDITVYGDVTVLDLIIAFTAIFLSVMIAKIVGLKLRRLLSDKISKDQLELILKVTYYSIVLIAVVSILPILGISLTGLLVAGGITGIILGFASQNVVSNFISGLFLLAEKPIKIGDQVTIEGVSGFVEDVRVMSTIIRTYDGLYVRIPNQRVFTSNITNLVANVARRFEYTVSISYSDDAEKAINIIKEIVEENPFVLKNPEPQVFVNNLGENGVDLVVRIWVPVTELSNVRVSLLWKIKKALEDNGIEIPFPQRVIRFARSEDRGVGR
ncbi:MAG: mechanosensitive ion channel family protein [Archaeoglobaceae archaeon]|nr:mechanosensitive ion channel family protein [Archaeoglobaceae archaeon]MCX8151841.1 mechanosensitive ion channel family protein [Archaeoglobaceae archaeon]MDW8014327.1 mechanosensitive ion channel family protein [Archaeoglobaceae archaeon]